MRGAAPERRSKYTTAIVRVWQFTKEKTLPVKKTVIAELGELGPRLNPTDKKYQLQILFWNGPHHNYHSGDPKSGHVRILNGKIFEWSGLA